MNAAGHIAEGADSAGRSARTDYVRGFAIAAVLTAAAFTLVISHALGNTLLTVAAVMGLAVAQVVVHMVFFLHMNSRSEGGWNLLALLFTLLLVLIVLSGSIWVMYHLNTNMMPPSPDDMRQMP
jgi:cytochrome o ubiquinol oxidase operon protein cyoD